MKVICAGYPRTGTKSMLMALQILGYRSHDIMQHYSLNFDNYIDLFEGTCAEGDMERLRSMYSEVDAVVEVPACVMWYKLLKAFPDAKVVLMEREDEERHGISVYTTTKAYMDTFGFFARRIQPWLSSTRAKLWRLENHVMAAVNPEWQTGIDKPKSYCHYYHLHNAAVKQLVPPDQLLVFNFKEGWAPLCKFLGCPVPEKEYPQMNATPKDGGVPSVVTETKTANVFKKITAETRWSVLVILSFAVGTCAGYMKKDIIQRHFINN